MSNNDCESYYEEPYAGKPHVRFCKGVHIARCGFTKPRPYEKTRENPLLVKLLFRRRYYL